MLLREHSPLEQVDAMPRIPYFIAQGDADKLVNKAAHADRMVEALRSRGLEVEYRAVPGMGHTGLPTYPLERRRIEFIKRNLRARQ